MSVQTAIEGDAVRAVVEIAAPPERVWAAIVSPGQLAEWWGQKGAYRTYDWRVDAAAGGQWSCEAEHADGNHSRVSGAVLEYDPPRTLAYTWNASWHPAPETVVRYTLTAAGAGTRVEVFHSGFGAGDPMHEGYASGWVTVLGNWQAFVEARPA